MLKNRLLAATAALALTQGVAGFNLAYAQMLPEPNVKNVDLNGSPIFGPTGTLQSKLLPQVFSGYIGADSHGSGAVGGVQVVTAAAGGNAATDAAAIQSNIDAIAALGGGVVKLEYGKNYLIATPLILRKGVQIDGVCPTTAADTSAPLLMCARLTASANMAAVITQADLTQPLHSAGLRNLVIEGNKSNYQVTNLVDVSMINGRIENNNIADGSGGCFYQRANQTAAWINWITGNIMGQCNGIGLNFEGSDSRIDYNYLSANGQNALINGTGAYSFSHNMIDNTNSSYGPSTLASNIAGTAGARVGAEFRCSDLNARHITTIVGNYFVQNGKADILISKSSTASSCSFRSPIVGNAFHATAATTGGGNIEIQPNISAGIVNSNEFSDSSPFNVVFDTAVGNTGWSFIGNGFSPFSFSPNSSQPFSNLPPDAVVLNAGDSGVTLQIPFQTLAVLGKRFSQSGDNAKISLGDGSGYLNYLFGGAVQIASYYGNFDYISTQTGSKFASIGPNGITPPVVTSSAAVPPAGSGGVLYIAKTGTTCQLSIATNAGPFSIGASFSCP